MTKKLMLLDAARLYKRRGWSVVPVPAGEKAPRLKKWQELRLTEPELAEYFNKNDNIGLLLGEPSKNLVDIDLDCDEAIELAPDFLPRTRRIHGRKSKRHSHWYYYSLVPMKPKKFCDLDGKCLVEIRSTGQQTIIPPSRHPSGERIFWESTGKPPRISSKKLLRRVRELAAACLCARHWPTKGSRHEVAKALAGLLLRARWDEAATVHFVSMVARAAGDEEWKKRKGNVRTTKKRLEEKGDATGKPRLEKLIGKHVVELMCEWLGIQASSAVAFNPSGTRAAWPAPPTKRAFYGLAGDVVRLIEPTTEADPVALLVQLLVLFGNVIGLKAHARVGAARHHANLFCVLVGQTSRARKGTALAEIIEFFEAVDRPWLDDRLNTGLSSGEGLIHAVRDPMTVGKKTDPGVIDKRLLAVEPEFAAVLKVARREGNTVSPVIRNAWDGGHLQILNKNSPAKATGAHVSIIGHITREELIRNFTETEGNNGFANRFLWVCVKRSRALPFGGKVDVRAAIPLRTRIRKAVKFSHDVGHITFSEKCKALWALKYNELTADVPGMLGAVTSRGEAQVLRLSLIYALLDHSMEVKVKHLRAAFALWRYCEDSARHIFGDSTGDFIADRILTALRNARKGLTLTQIRNLFKRNRSHNEITRALGILVENGLARSVRETTKGRTAQRWFAT
jgi:hypothetical protein